jgi:hypothetical protein
MTKRRVGMLKEVRWYLEGLRRRKLQADGVKRSWGEKEGEGEGSGRTAEEDTTVQRKEAGTKVVRR